MNQKLSPIFIGETPQKPSAQDIQGEYVTLLGDTFYKIQNYAAMPPFFMTIVSSSNHWIFISSTGGLSAGRVSAEQSLFPYYPEDKLAENSENTGNKAILLATRAGRTHLWEPFSSRQPGIYCIERNLYKNVAGDTVVFEENNHSLGLTYRYAWRTSDAYGLIKTTWLKNIGNSPCQVDLVDGLQNILPANVSSQTQHIFSCLLDAYKRSELDPETGLAIFALNSTLTDLAEPSESLLANTVFQLGLAQADILLSVGQLDRFSNGFGVVTETEERGQRCAYFVHTTFDLAPDTERSWHLVAEVSQDSAAIVRLAKSLREDADGLAAALKRDIEANHLAMQRIVARADGLQVSSRGLRSANHFANVMFNAMRGGIFVNQYRVHTHDFIEFIRVRNRGAFEKAASFFASLPSEILISDLQARADASGSEDLFRLSYAYLPLYFSRRHGDPSRPWNRFAINIKKDDGSLRLDYEGNWRDIFQNWEALAFSYPGYVESMMGTFLNATTVDGYNPYRITGQGIEWEHPEPENPWANIGYWSDHQIIYLQKLMEISARVHPGKLQGFLTRRIFSYANVPYRIKPYADLKLDPYKSIDFDWDLEREIDARVQERGTDARLVSSPGQQVLQATLAEKLLTLLLAKLVNFVPEGGIWMNTQRPEWNDANNALVGKGLSVVTLCYLRRFIVFYRDLLKPAEKAFSVTQMRREVQGLYSQVYQILTRFQDVLQGAFSDEERGAMMDALGKAGSDSRWNYYRQGLSGEFSDLPVSDLAAFLDLALSYVDHSLRANRRPDALFHAYNILHLDRQRASISHLYEMLEGQVAILSSGLLSGAESLDLLSSLQRSQLYRSDQHSFILYPDRKLTGFLAKNCIPPDRVSRLGLVSELVKAQDKTLITQDIEGNYHFSGQLRNGKDVIRSLNALQSLPQYTAWVKAESVAIQALFESTFHHDEFTGRSGAFFAYEGLGSIYWHMVSKLLLAVQETIARTQNEPSTAALLEKYFDFRRGQGFNQTPGAYGAFPTDPYSHTPKSRGAQQPGMTGSVKEEILTRQWELGLSIEDGSLAFDFLLLDRREFLRTPSVFSYWGVDEQPHQIELKAGSLAYSICQVPIILQSSDAKRIEIHWADGSIQQIDGYRLPAIDTRHIFLRDNAIHHLVVLVAENP